MIILFLALSALVRFGIISASDAVMRNGSLASTFLQLDFLPPCIRSCSENYLINVEKYYVSEGIRKILPVICEEWTDVGNCLKSTCDPKQLHFVDDLFQGFNYTCSEHNAFLAVFPCMDEYADLKQTCGKCDIYQSGLTFVESQEIQRVMREGGSAYRALEYAGPICGNISCSLPCIRDEVNIHCDNAGAKLMELFARPLIHLHQSFLNSKMQRELVEQIPKECKHLMSKAGLREIIFDEEFEKGIMNYINDRRRELLYMENQESTLEETEDTTPLQRFWAVIMKPFYIGFIAFVLILNVSALVITVVWCVTKRETVPKSDVRKKARLPFHVNRKKKNDE